MAIPNSMQETLLLEYGGCSRDPCVFFKVCERIIVRYSFDSILLIYKDFFRANVSEHHFSMGGKATKKGG